VGFGWYPVDISAVQFIEAQPSIRTGFEPRCR
jgi:hypothetical protein